MELVCDYSSKEFKEEEDEAQTLDRPSADYTNEISQTKRYSYISSFLIILFFYVNKICMILNCRPPSEGGPESGIVPVGQQHPSLEGKQLPRFRYEDEIVQVGQ